MLQSSLCDQVAAEIFLEISQFFGFFFFLNPFPLGACLMNHLHTDPISGSASGESDRRFLIATQNV